MRTLCTGKTARTKNIQRGRGALDEGCDPGCLHCFVLLPQYGFSFSFGYATDVWACEYMSLLLGLPCLAFLSSAYFLIFKNRTL